MTIGETKIASMIRPNPPSNPNTNGFIALLSALLVALCSAVALAQVMTPNITPPGGLGQQNPNQGQMTPNAQVQQGSVITCQGTGYDFTLSCNSQYIVVL